MDFEDRDLIKKLIESTESLRDENICLQNKVTELMHWGVADILMAIQSLLEKMDERQEVMLGELVEANREKNK